MGSSIVLADPAAALGRSQDNQIVVPDASVSRRHCVITRGADGHLTLADQSSRGTFVNGLPVSQHVLEHEDVISVGDSEFVVYLREPSPDQICADDEPLETSSALIAKMKSGDGAAMEALMRRTLPALRRWARGRLPRYARDLMDTEDVVQEAVLSTLKRVGEFEPHHAGSFEAYLRTAIQNKVRDEMRRVARRVVAAELPDDAQSQTPSPLERAVEREAFERYEHALEKLRPAERVAIVLRLEFEHSFEEIATGLGKASPAAARMAVNRALMKLSAFMRAQP